MFFTIIKCTTSMLLKVQEFLLSEYCFLMFSRASNLTNIPTYLSLYCINTEDKSHKINLKQFSQNKLFPDDSYFCISTFQSLKIPTHIATIIMYRYKISYYD